MWMWKLTFTDTDLVTSVSIKETSTHGVAKIK